MTEYIPSVPSRRTSEDRIVRRIRRLERRLDSAVRHPQLPHSAIDDGAVTVTVDGVTTGLVGMQYDGTTAAVTVNGPTPPTPAAPVVQPVVGGVRVTVTGQWQDPQPGFSSPVVAPQDFHRWDVEVSADSSFPEFAAPNASNNGSVISPGGGDINVAWPTAGQLVYVRLRARARSGKRSAPSAAVSINTGAVGLADIGFDLASYAAGNTIVYSATQPPNPDRQGTLWVKEVAAGPPPLYETRRWTGATWQLLQDQGINAAIVQADAAAVAAANRARIFTQASAPVYTGAADTAFWFDSDDGQRPYRWNGSAWVDHRLGNGAIQPGSLVASSVIATGTISAALLEALMVLASAIVAGDATGAHARMDPNGFTVYALNTDGEQYAVVRMGTSSDDYFALTSATGQLMASVDSTGMFQGRAISVAEWPTISAADWTGTGGELDEVLDRRPRGLVSWGGQYTNAASSSNSTAGVGVYEISARTHPGRMYKLCTSPLRVSGSVAGDLAEVQIRATSAAAGTTVATPSITSDILARSHVHIGRIEANSTQITKLIGPPTAAQGSIDMRMLLCYSRAAGTGNVLLNAGVPDVLEMWLEDIGPWSPNQQLASSGAGTVTPPAPGQRIVQVNSTWVESYKADGNRRTNVEAWQGYGDSYNGMQRSFIGFPDLTGTLAGSTITEIAVLLWSEYWWWNSGGQAVVGQHGYASPPGSLGANRTENMAQAPMARGEKRWIQLPLTNSSFWLTGQYRGIMLGSAGMGTNTLYYGRFNSAATLSIKYTK